MSILSPFVISSSLFHKVARAKKETKHHPISLTFDAYIYNENKSWLILLSCFYTHTHVHANPYISIKKTSFLEMYF